MKKLKNKVFFTIFLILTIFILGVFITYNYQNYKMRKNNISQEFMRMTNNMIKENEANIVHKPSPNNDNLKGSESVKKIFLDSTIYTILLDENGNYKELITHTEDYVDEEEVKKIAEDIIKNHKYNTYIGNLYINDYSYSFSNHDTLIIISNVITKTELTTILINSLINFILLEIIVIILSFGLTNWIIKPVILSFEKQKQFVADASHELKTPLAVIMASIEAYECDKNNKWITNVKNETERMNNLVTSLLDLATLESNKINKTYTFVNISKIIESSVLTFESILYDKKIKLEYNIEKNIFLTCDEEQIKQIMETLLDNAIKHSDPKGKIIVNLKEEKNKITLEVKNKGNAIKKGEEEKIFERFYRSDDARNRNDNRYGLGLAIAKSIVENYNGEIKAFSNSGYTTFQITWNRK